MDNFIELAQGVKSFECVCTLPSVGCLIELSHHLTIDKM
jgi:hypothetical protein